MPARVPLAVGGDLTGRPPVRPQRLGDSTHRGREERREESVEAGVEALSHLIRRARDRAFRSSRSLDASVEARTPSDVVRLEARWTALDGRPRLEVEVPNRDSQDAVEVFTVAGSIDDLPRELEVATPDQWLERIRELPDRESDEVVRGRIAAMHFALDQPIGRSRRSTSGGRWRRAVSGRATPGSDRDRSPVVGAAPGAERRLRSSGGSSEIGAVARSTTGTHSGGSSGAGPRVAAIRDAGRGDRVRSDSTRPVTISRGPWDSRSPPNRGKRRRGADRRSRSARHPETFDAGGDASERSTVGASTAWRGTLVEAFWPEGPRWSCATRRIRRDAGEARPRRGRKAPWISGRRVEWWETQFPLRDRTRGVHRRAEGDRPRPLVRTKEPGSTNDTRDTSKTCRGGWFGVDSGSAAENWKRRRAPAWPYFLRSTFRASRVR